jgi:hypothetical protein
VIQENKKQTQKHTNAKPKGCHVSIQTDVQLQVSRSKPAQERFNHAVRAFKDKEGGLRG